MYRIPAGFITPIFVVLITVIGQGCEFTGFSEQPRRLSYEVFVEPDEERIRIAGNVSGLGKNTYHFALPRTQGQPPAHFVKYVSFSDSLGALTADVNELGEWEVWANGLPVSFVYHINLQQSMKYEQEAWGGAMTQLEDGVAFLNGSLSFMVPLVSNIEDGIAMQWHAPQGWSVVTPWTTDTQRLVVPSQYGLVNNYFVAFKDGSVFSQRIRHLDLNIVWLGSDDINNYPAAAISMRNVVDAGLEFFGDDTSKEAVTLILRDSNAQNRFRASTEANTIEFNFKKGMTFNRIWRDHKDGFLRLLAHEIMHTWDRREVKEASAHLHVREWGEQTCWLREGFTEYFAMLNLYKAGVNDLATFVNTMQAISEAASRTNGAQQFSLTSACSQFFHNEDALGFVYTGGATLAFMLDLELRESTDGAASLPAFMMSYMSEHRYKEKTNESFLEAWQAYAPVELHHLAKRLAFRGVLSPEELLAGQGLTKRQTRQANLFYWEIPSQSKFQLFFR